MPLPHNSASTMCIGYDDLFGFGLCVTLSVIFVMVVRVASKSITTAKNLY